MITVTKDKVSRTFDNRYLDHVCLEVAGGGYTNFQTARAMALRAEVEELGHAEYKGVKISMTEKEG